MKKTSLSILVGTGVLASSLLFLPPTTSTFAQMTQPTPQTQRMDTRDDDDNTGLWGLLGLAGLIGLAGLRRPKATVGAYDARERSKV